MNGSEKINVKAVNLKQLLMPISEDRPSGEFLKLEDPYRQLQELRKEDQDLPMGIWKTDLKMANWDGVKTLALQVLYTQSKDLQIAAWLLESLLHLHGFSGVNTGLKVLVQLCEGFWDTAYPPIMDGKIEMRLSPLVWINTKLPLQLKSIQLTRAQAEKLRQYNRWDWERAKQIEDQAGYDYSAPEDQEEGAEISLKLIEQKIQDTPTEFYQKLEKHILESLASLVTLESLLEERCGADYEPPTLFQFRETLEVLLFQIQSILKERGMENPEEIPQEGDSMDAEPPPNVNNQALLEPGTPSEEEKKQALRAREWAYQQLETAAAILEEVEPHSPTPLLIRRAIAWGGMSFGDLVSELFQNQELQHLQAILGLQQKTKP